MKTHALRVPRHSRSQLHWIDLAVSFDLLGLGWLALVSGEFKERVQSWIADGLADRFYFMHKPPGMHLRFRTERKQLLGEVGSFLDEQIVRGGLGKWHRGVYDSETHRFGGEVGMDIAHDFFTVESLLVLGYVRAFLCGKTHLLRPQFSLLLLLELFERVVEGRWELWDIWCKMELVDRLPRLSAKVLGAARLEAERASAVVGPLLQDRPALLRDAAPIERELLDAFQPQVDRIARRLAVARDAGQLLYGLRSILPSWAVFHWNRMGFSASEQRLICLAMVHLLGPDAS